MAAPFEPAWDDFRLVKAIADYHTLPAAAGRLGINHSTIFRRLNQIEAAVGHPLFERLRAGYVPTPAGERMVQAASEMEAQVATFGRLLAGEDITPTGEVRITTSDSLLLNLVMPLLSQIRASLPGIRLDLVIGNESLNLSKRDADIAIRATDNPPETLVGRRIASVAWALYGRADAFAPGTTVSAEELAGHDVVSLGDNFAALAVVRQLRDKVPPERLACRLNTVMGLAEAIEAGLGIGHLPAFIGDTRATLTRLSPPDPAFAGDLWLLTHADLRRVPRVRSVLDLLGTLLSAQRPLLEGERSLRLS